MKYFLLISFLLVTDIAKAQCFWFYYRAGDNYNRLTKKTIDVDFGVYVGKEKRVCEINESLSDLIYTAKPKRVISENKYDRDISIASSLYEVEPELIKAIIKAESNFNPLAESHKGAKGLMQLIDQTADQYNVDDSFNPSESIIGGTAYFSDLIEYYQGDKVKALAAYNSGKRAVDKSNGIPPFKETQNYVPKVLGFYQLYLKEKTFK